jgi:hypothetical protein
MNYNYVDSYWYWLLFVQDYNHTDYNNGEHLNTVSFLNLLVNSFFVLFYV